MIRLDTARAEVGAAPTATGFTRDFDHLFSTVGDAALRRDAGGEHVTASCLVIDPDTESVLLNHHRKADLWGQFGGHLEPEDDSLCSAAHREATEESGLSNLSWFSPPRSTFMSMTCRLRSVRANATSMWSSQHSPP